MVNDDLLLQQRVLDELEFEPSVEAAHIGVAAHNGVVTLAGHVSSYTEKFAAERAARRVRGVKAVAMELEVRLPDDRKLADDEIAERALRILNWDVSVPAERIGVRVERGIVTLTGEVAWQFQRGAAEHDIHKLSGVRAVINNITVAPQVQAEDVRAKIRAALERSAEVEACNVGVAVAGGKVTLTGRVGDWKEREEIVRAAWAAPGVTEVFDELVVAET
ncbi:MAG TPA: BON domain-containing protein [Acetobacteraceae bacterium]|nr:BON domain-containing protein [Acetobacteraceae bacterium]